MAARSTAPPARSIALSISAGHVRSAHCNQTPLIRGLRGAGEQRRGQTEFSGVPAEADRQQPQLRGVLQALGSTSKMAATILSDGAEGPRSLGEAVSLGPVRHVLDWFHLSIRIQHAAQSSKSWPEATRNDRRDAARLHDAIAHIRRRRWHGQIRRHST